MTARAPDGYDAGKYPPFAVTVDIVLATVRQGRLCLLLVERAAHPYQGEWALPGGFVGIDESLHDAAVRELAEETGIQIGAGKKSVGHLEQLATYGDPGRDPRMRVVSVAHVALMPDLPTPVADSDAANARWWPVEDLALGSKRKGLLRLAFDHDQIARDGIERIRAKLEYTTLATAFLEAPFSIPDLRRVYEAVWGEELDPANFARKVLATPGFVEPTGRTSDHGDPDGGRRPALYVPGKATELVPPFLRS